MFRSQVCIVATKMLHMLRNRSFFFLMIIIGISTAALVIVRAGQSSFGGVPVYSISWAPDGSRLAGGAADGSVIVWTLEDDQRQVILPQSTNPIVSVRWSPDGALLAALSQDRVTLWNTATWEVVDWLDLSSHFHTDGNPMIAWAPDGTLFLANLSYQSSGYGLQLDRWDMRNSDPVFIGELNDQSFSILVMEWSYQGDRLIVGSGIFDGGAFVEPLISLWAPQTFSSVAWSPDDQQIAAASLFDFGIVTICDSSAGKAIRQLPEKMSHVNAVRWSSDGKWLAAGGHWTRNGTNLGAYYEGKFDLDRGALYIWNTTTWNAIESRTWAEIAVQDIAFSPDSRLLAVALGNGRVLLLDSESGRERDHLQ
jgi:WD40 repeat protein